VPGVRVGQLFESRKHLYDANVHLQSQAGIDGTAASGCYSIVISGGYEDDDKGEEVVYTGCGGFIYGGGQLRDQEFEGKNASLVVSYEKKLPVRVCRGFGGSSHYAPDQGYRYDGLYLVEECWSETGSSGFKLCRFRLRQMPDQPPLPPPNTNKKKPKPKPRPLPLLNQKPIPKTRAKRTIEEVYQETTNTPSTDLYSLTAEKNEDVAWILRQIEAEICVECGLTFPNEILLEHLEVHRLDYWSSFTKEEQEILAIRTIYNDTRIRTAIETLENNIQVPMPVYQWTQTKEEPLDNHNKDGNVHHDNLNDGLNNYNLKNNNYNHNSNNSEDDNEVSITTAMMATNITKGEKQQKTFSDPLLSLL